jgi:hypothetical protein
MKLVLTVVAIAAAVIVTAVGLAVVAEDDGPTEAEYKVAVVAARNQTNEALARVTQATSREDLTVRMDQAAVAIDDAADDLDAAGTTARFERPHEQLVSALHQLSADLEGTAEQIRDPNFEDILAGTQGLSFESWDRINAQLARLSAAGVEVRALERH